MSQGWIPASFWRGGTSKGVFFHAKDLPRDRAALDAIFLAVLGSPDPYGRQLDGMGGGISSLSKAVIIGPPSRPDADIDYTFAQVSVDRPEVDWSGNCGNLSAAVGPFALEEGLVQVPDGEATLRIHQVNTAKIIQARFAVQGGRPVTEGALAIAGVSGTGAPIAVEVLDPGGSVASGLLPSGNMRDLITLPDGGTIDASLVDATNPVVFLNASDFGLTGMETPEQIEADTGLMARLEVVRRLGGVAMGLAADPRDIPLANPRVALLSAPASFAAMDGQVHDAGSHDIAVRMLSMGRVHRAVTLTGAMCLGVAARIAGTIAHDLARPASARELRIANPSGLLSTSAAVRQAGGRWIADTAGVYRTARCLMKGAVAVPQPLFQSAYFQFEVQRENSAR